MEEERTNWEQSNLISELIQGMELAKQLKQHVNADSPAGTMDVLLHQILSSYEKSLVILKCNRSAPLPESPISVNGSPQSDDFDRENCENRSACKKRWNLEAYIFKKTKHFDATSAENVADTYAYEPMLMAFVFGLTQKDVTKMDEPSEGEL